MLTAPSPAAYVSLLRQCVHIKSLSTARRLRVNILAYRAGTPTFVLDFLVMTLAKCGAVEDALELSSSLPGLTVFSWTAIISAYADRGLGHEAIRSYKCMLDQGVEPDHYTFVSLLKACGSSLDILHGRKLHADARRKGFTADVSVCNSLVTMYGKLGHISEAENIFRFMDDHTTVSWNAMMSAYVEAGRGADALLLYRQMREGGVKESYLTIIVVIQACSNLMVNEAFTCPSSLPACKMMCLHIGQALHRDAYRKDFIDDPLVGSSIVSMYGKCGSITEARNAFQALIEWNVVCWTAMGAAYVEDGQGDKALKLFTEMLKQNINPNSTTYITTLQACGVLLEEEIYLLKKLNLSRTILLEIVHALHADANSYDITSDVLLSNTLINIYGKFGSILESKAVFDQMIIHDTTCWNTMLLVYLEHGHVDKAAYLYKQMQDVNSEMLDEVTAIYVLHIASETGSIKMCQHIHFIITCGGLELVPFVSATLIHAYGDCGCSINSQVVFNAIIQPDIAVWNACIDSFAGKGELCSCFRVCEEAGAVDIKLDAVTCTLLLSVVSRTGLVVEGLKYFVSLSTDRSIVPVVQHYGILSDMFGRVGDFSRARAVINNMPMQADLAMWLSLLGSCCIHGNLELAMSAFKNAISILPEEETAYLLISNVSESEL